MTDEPKTAEQIKAHEEMMDRIDASFLLDYNGSRRRYADQVSTSEALRKRVASARAERNGHT